MRREEVEECSSCGFGPVEAVQCDSNYRHMKWRPGEEPWLCDVCADSLVGNAYPDVVVLRTIAACTNMVLKEIRDSRDAVLAELKKGV